jgi:hypothetical protein
MRESAGARAAGLLDCGPVFFRNPLPDSITKYEMCGTEGRPEKIFPFRKVSYELKRPPCLNSSIAGHCKGGRQTRYFRKVSYDSKCKKV